MPRQTHPYKCPRCGLTTLRCDNIKKHFSLTKKKCLPILRDIELSEHVKELVLNNRDLVFCTDRDLFPLNNVSASYITNNNNQNNNIQNNNIQLVINQISCLDRLRMYKNHGNDIKSLEENTLLFLNGTELDDYKKDPIDKHMTNENVIAIVKELSRFSSNFLYDKTEKSYFFMTNRDISKTSEHEIICKQVQNLKHFYLCEYEKFLIRMFLKLEGTDDGLTCESHLKNYYKLLYAFDNKPCIVGMLDNEFLYDRTDERHSHDDDKYSIEEKINVIYNDVVENSTYKEIKNIYQRGIKIIHDSAGKNMQEINQKILDLLEIDSDFRNQMQSLTNNPLSIT